MPLGIQPTRAVHSRGFSLSLGLIFLYYLLLTFGQNLGERGTLPPMVAVWLPNVVLSVVGRVLLLRAGQEAARAPLSTVGSRSRRCVRRLVARRGQATG